MRFKTSFKLSLLALLSGTAFSAHADNYVVVAPQCLLHGLSNYKSLANEGSLSLLELDKAGFKQLINARDAQKQLCGGFFNVSAEWKGNAQDAKGLLTKYSAAAKPLAKTNYEAKYPTQVNQVLALMDPKTMWQTLTYFSSYPDRYADSSTGLDAANWIKTQVETMAKAAGRNDVTVYVINTGTDYKQPSVIAKITPANAKQADAAGVVVSGHMDTLEDEGGHMPGADDDGSGAMTTLEAARSVISSKMQFNKPIYFMWFSAEEEGLVGSEYVVAEFKSKNIPIDGVLHFDMTAYSPKSDYTMWVIDDYVDKDLTNFLATLITTYVKVPVQHTACGYACSDHATWTQNGYKASIATEAKFGYYDPYLHTSEDKINILSMTHMANFAKLAAAFAIEMAEPVATKK